jgi:hypothetical protein
LTESLFTASLNKGGIQVIKHTLFAAASAICLSACGSGDKVDLENASVNDVAKELRKADANEGFVKPGQWEQTVTLVEMSPQKADGSEPGPQVLSDARAG